MLTLLRETNSSLCLHNIVCHEACVVASYGRLGLLCIVMLRKGLVSAEWSTVKADTVCFCNHCFSSLFNLCTYYYYTQNIFVYYLVTLYYVHVYYVALSLTLPHKSSSLRDPTTQTTDGDIQSAKPPLFSPSGFTPHRVVTAWAQSTGLFVAIGETW